jgi:hypothetical protein
MIKSLWNNYHVPVSRSLAGVRRLIPHINVVFRTRNWRYFFTVIALRNGKRKLCNQEIRTTYSTQNVMCVNVTKLRG